MARRRSQRGASLIEAALILPLVAMLALGAVEYGFLFRDVNRIERGLQSAGRTGSTVGTGRFADFEILRAIDTALGGMSGASIERVVVFQASALDGDVPASCRTAVLDPSSMSAQGSSTPGARCNVYSPAQVSTQSPSGFPTNSAGNTCSAGSWDAAFCPPVHRSNRSGSSTYLGVYVRAEYTPFTSIIPSPTLTVERTTVYRIEPCVPLVQECS